VPVHERAGREVEGDEPRLAEPVAAVVEHPEAVLRVDAQRQRALPLEPAREAARRERHGLAVDELEERRRRARVGVERREHAARGRDRDVPGRMREIGDLLERGARERGFARPVRELRAAAVARAHAKGGEQRQRDQKDQRVAQRPHAAKLAGTGAFRRGRAGLVL
jgi:hypothetical protein